MNLGLGLFDVEAMELESEYQLTVAARKHQRRESSKTRLECSSHHDDEFTTRAPQYVAGEPLDTIHRHWPGQ